MKKVLTSILLVFVVAFSFAQDITPEQYIAAYKDLAIREMKRMGVPASITLAQGILETQNGNSDLVKKSNNHFGIKCKTSWTAQGVFHDDDATGECFRKYVSADESYRDHSNFLRGSDRYHFLFKLDVKDYRAWAYGLKNAGYATNPAYPEILIKNIEQYNLQQYTLQAANDVPKYNISENLTEADEKMPTTNLQNETSTTSATNNNIEKINGTKCFYAGKGTSLLALAIENNISLKNVLVFNDLNNDGLLAKNQFIYLEKKQTTGATATYIATEDETLYDVAQKNAVQIKSLQQYNNLLPNSILKKGTPINLQPSNKLNISANTLPQKVKLHIVAPKEGLYAIAKKYNVSVQQIINWNNLQNNSLIIGQKLIVSN